MFFTHCNNMERVKWNRSLSTILLQDTRNCNFLKNNGICNCDIPMESSRSRPNDYMKKKTVSSMISNELIVKYVIRFHRSSRCPKLPYHVLVKYINWKQSKCLQNFGTGITTDKKPFLGVYSE